jgi:hypothetical protein
LKETDAIGVNLGSASKKNNLIIKEILGIYFEIIKNKNNSPLIKAVFLGLPQFIQWINVEIVWDLINVLREFLKMELEENADIVRQSYSYSNVLACLLCSFQIIEIGSGTAFNVEEKDFIDSLYIVIMKLFENPKDYSMSDFLALLKCLTIVFIQRRQYSNDLVAAFMKRMALVQMHLMRSQQSGLLFMIKQMMTKYP